MVNLFGMMSDVFRASRRLPPLEKFLDIAQDSLQLRKQVHSQYVKTLTDKGLDIRLVSNSYGTNMPTPGMEALQAYEKEVMYELGGAKGIERLQRMVGPDFQRKFESMLGLQLEDIRNLPDADLRNDPGILQQVMGQHKEQIRSWGEQMFVPGKKVNGIEVNDWETFRRFNRNDSIRYKKAEILKRSGPSGTLPDDAKKQWAELPEMEFEVGERIRNIDLPHYTSKLRSNAIFTNPSTGARYKVEMIHKGRKSYGAARTGSGNYADIEHAYIDPRTNEIVEWAPGPGKNPRKVLRVENDNPVYGERIPGVSKKDVFVPMEGSPTLLSEAHLRGIRRLPDDTSSLPKGIQEAGKKRKKPPYGSSTRVGVSPTSKSITVYVKPQQDMEKWEAATNAEVIKNIVKKYNLPDDSPPRFGYNKLSDDQEYISWFKNKFTLDEVADFAGQNIDLVKVHDDYIDTLSKAVRSRSSREATDMMNIGKGFEFGAMHTSDSMSSKSVFAFSKQAERSGAPTGEVGSRAYKKRQAIREKGGIPGEVSVYDDTFQLLNSIDRGHASGPLSGIRDYRRVSNNEYGDLNAIFVNDNKGSMSFEIELDPLHYFGKKKILSASEDVANLPSVDKGTRRIVTGGLYEAVGYQGLRKPREAVEQAVKKISGPAKQPVPPEELLAQARLIGKEKKLLRTSTDVAEAVRNYLEDIPLNDLKKIVGNDTPVQYVRKTLGPAIKRSEAELRKGFGPNFKLVFRIEKVPSSGYEYFQIQVLHSKVEVAASLSKATIDKKVLGALPVLEGIRWEYGGEEK